MKEKEYKEAMREQNLRARNAMQKIKNRIVVFSGKGGVGKTMLSVNLAYALSKLGYKTGLLDADVTGPNVAKMSGMEDVLETNENGIIPLQKGLLKVVSFAGMITEGQAVIWRGPMRSKLLNSFIADVNWGDLDFLIADLPPGTGDEIITITQKMEPHLAIIVTTPQEVSLIDSFRAINMARTLDIPKISMIENMSGLTCPNCGKTTYLFGKGGGKKQAKEMKIDFLGSIPIEPKVRELADEGKSLISCDPESDFSVKIKGIAKQIDLTLQKKNKLDVPMHN